MRFFISTALIRAEVHKQWQKRIATLAVNEEKVRQLLERIRELAHQKDWAAWKEIINQVIKEVYHLIEKISDRGVVGQITLLLRHWIEKDEIPQKPASELVRIWEIKDTAIVDYYMMFLNRLEAELRGDIVFIPHKPNYNQFSVATVSGEYDFEERRNEPQTWRQDFGHIIQVENRVEYDYFPNFFGAPYISAVNRISDEHRAKFDNFLSQKGYSESGRVLWIFYTVEYV